MKRTLTVACLQTEPQATFEAAIAQARGLVHVASDVGAELLVLPEYCGGLIANQASLTPPSAPESEHPVLHALCEMAAKHGVWIVPGSLAIQSQQQSDGDRIRNRCYVIDETGTVRTHYDKIHLFDINHGDGEAYHESATVAPGNEAIIVDMPQGRLGLSICYDLRFPELYRTLAHAGAELLLVPAAFTARTGEAHWHTLLKARAIENGAFVVAPCAVGSIPGGGRVYGHSLIVNPWGEVVVDGGDLPGVMHTTLDLSEVESTRQRIPSLSHDQTFSVNQVTGLEVA